MLLCCCSQGGWVVCEEDKDTLLEAWDEDIVEQRKKEAAVSIDFMSLISLYTLQRCQVSRFRRETPIFTRPLWPPVWQDLWRFQVIKVPKKLRNVCKSTKMTTVNSAVVLLSRPPVLSLILELCLPFFKTFQVGIYANAGRKPATTTIMHVLVQS